MEEVELIIKMPKIEYEHLTNEEKFSSLEKDTRYWLINKTLNRVAEGTLLPEGHERTGEEEAPKRLTNKEWVDFLSEQFDVSRTSAKEMLHAMMSVKREDNLKKQFNKPAKTEEMDEAVQDEEEER